MVVVSDTTTITNLIHIDRLYLLQQLYLSIVLPEEVYRELSELPEQKEVIDQQNWINIAKVNDLETLNELIAFLDKGEAEAITIALEKKADLLIIDEMAGRIIAKEKNIRIIGLLGILIASKDKGLIKALKPMLDQLLNDHGFRVNPKLYR